MYPTDLFLPHEPSKKIGSLTQLHQSHPKNSDIILDISVNDARFLVEYAELFKIYSSKYVQKF